MNRAPRLAAYILTDNSARFLQSTLESVLAQSPAVEMEVVIVDRGSEDETAQIAGSFQDARCTLTRIERTASPSRCHQLALHSTTAPIIVHVGAGDIVLQGAFNTLLTEFEHSPDVGLLHCYWFDIDEHGNTTRDAFRAQQELQAKSIKPDMDYREQLLLSDWMLGPLRAYRRNALEKGLDENELPLPEYAAALRIAGRWQISLIPEILCARRSAGPMTWPALLSKAFKDAVARHRQQRRLRKGKEVLFLSKEPYKTARLFPSFLSPVERRLMRDKLEWLAPFSSGSLWTRWHKRGSRLLNGVQYQASIRLWWWPIDLLHPKRRSRLSPPRKIAYYFWHFPVHSQTFIHRELAALVRSGMSVSIIADSSEGLDIMDHNARFLMKQVEYVQPAGKHQLRQYKRFFLRTRPLLYCNLLFYVMTRLYRLNKHIHDDRDLFSKAVYLAGMLRSKGIEHVHTPWADETAMIALVAARLLGASYSVQARAHDIHRTTNLYALREKFENAEFIVTNTEYNQKYLQAMLRAEHRNRVFLIHNGLDLEKFDPPPAPRRHNARFRILSVGRLIEQKGLEYLLKACSLLRDRGLDFECEIIGGPELPLYSDYFVGLKLLHGQLHLEDRVTFSGTLPFSTVLDRYAKADVFVLPCVIARDGSRDITPNALIEAMAMRLPVISTPTTGVPEIVEDRCCGILAQQADEASLADAIAELSRDPELRERFGSNARKRVEEKFDISRNIASYVDLFSGRSLKY